MIEPEVNIGRFGEVDTSGQVDLMLAYLDLFENLPGMDDVRAESYVALGPVAGRRVVDVGCGTGKAVAELLAAGAVATGIEPSESFVTIAEERYPGLDIAVGRAESLPFEDQSIDLLRSERVFMHIADTAEALAEYRRVLVPGGGVVLIDLDADMWAIDADDAEVTARMMLGFKDTLTNPQIGRRYRSSLLDAGFENVEVSLRVLAYHDFNQVAGVLAGVAMVASGGRVTQAEADAWLAEQMERSERDRFFIIAPLFVATAIAPPV